MKKIIALGVSAVSAATMTFVSISPAGAADPVSTVTSTICGVLPAQVTGLTGQLTAALSGITSSKTALDTSQAALPGAVNDLVASIVGYIGALDSGDGVASAAQLVGARSSAYAEKVVAADTAANAWFAAQRAAFLTGLANQYMGGVQDGLCTP